MNLFGGYKSERLPRHVAPHGCWKAPSKADYWLPPQWFTHAMVGTCSQSDHCTEVPPYPDETSAASRAIKVHRMSKIVTRCHTWAWHPYKNIRYNHSPAIVESRPRLVQHHLHQQRGGKLTPCLVRFKRHRETSSVWRIEWLQDTDWCTPAGDFRISFTDESA